METTPSVISQEANTPCVETASRDKSLLHGIAWTGAVQWSSQIISWLSTITVARLLSPEDYGLVAMAAVVMGLINLCNEAVYMGVVSVRSLTVNQIPYTHGFAILIGMAGFIVSLLVAIPMGHFYRASEVPLIMITMGAGYAVGTIRAIPVAILNKELRFKFLAFLDGGMAIVTTLMTLGLALWGAGYWALVVGVLMGSLSATAVVSVYRPIRPLWPTWESVRELIKLSSHILGNRLSWYVASQSSLFITGRILGHAALGVYSFAVDIANVQLDKVTSLASKLMPAIYSSVRSDPPALRRYFLLLTEGVSIITFPSGVGLSLIARDGVALIFGEKWLAIVGPLQILACWASLRSVAGLLDPILYVTGGSHKMMFNGIYCAITFPLTFWVASRFGIVGIAAAWVVVQPPSWVIPYRHVLRATGLALPDYVRALWPALSSTLLMGAGILGMQQVIPHDWPLTFRLIVEFLGGASMYVASMLGFHRGRVRLLFEWIRSSGA